MKIVVLSQARLNSTRLPRKVLKDVFKNYNCISLLKKRLSFSKRIDLHSFIVPASDLILIRFLEDNNIPFVIGPENNLIERHLIGAKELNADVIVRITSDCPLVDSRELDRGIDLYFDNLKEKFLYVSNHTPPENSDYPNGSDIEIFSRDCLEYISHNYKNSMDKEHVTFPMWDGRETKNILHIKMKRKTKKNLVSKVRLTIDNPEDLQVLRILSKNLDIFNSSLSEIENKYNELQLYKLNSHFNPRDGWK